MFEYTTKRSNEFYLFGNGNFRVSFFRPNLSCPHLISDTSSTQPLHTWLGFFLRSQKIYFCRTYNAHFLMIFLAERVWFPAMVGDELPMTVSIINIEPINLGSVQAIYPISFTNFEANNITNNSYSPSTRKYVPLCVPVRLLSLETDWPH